MTSKPTNKSVNPFRFHTRLNFIELTGKRARTLNELLIHLREADEPTIYYHTHHFLQKHQFLSPEPPNDFAYWIHTAVQESRVAEQVAAVDFFEYSSLTQLKDAFVNILERAVNAIDGDRKCPIGMEFHFLRAKTFVLPTKHEAATLRDFYDILRKITIHSIYYHMFGAKLRLSRGENDFSDWIENNLGMKRLAQKISHVDPYVHTMEGLRTKICQLIREELTSAEY